MDLIDILWNLFRKSLSKELYSKLKKGPFGRPYNYYTISTYSDIFNHYKSAGLEFNSKNVLEIGPGAQYYTSYFFLSAGAKSVSLVDPVFNADSLTSRQLQLTVFLEHMNMKSIDETNIQCYDSLESISSLFDNSFDIICSHFVLEHFDNLESFFKNTKRLLKPNGLCYSYVDLSDHVYHVFNSRPWTKWIYRTRMLYHLRYSDYLYNFITDKRIWVNRLLLPAYKSLSNKYSLQIIDTKPSLYHRVKIHKDVLTRNHTSNQSEFYITHFGLLLKK